MPDEEDKTKTTIGARFLAVLLGLPWPEAFGELWRIGRDLLNGLRTNGIYEVIDYESTLELKNIEGTKATFSKRKKIRYLQDNIIAHQDYAWGDGEILHNYRTSKGKPVDRYRSGYKTYILLSHPVRGKVHGV